MNWTILTWLIILCAYVPVGTRFALGSRRRKKVQERLIVEERVIPKLEKWHDVHFETLMETQDWTLAVAQADKGVFLPARMSLTQALDDAKTWANWDGYVPYSQLPGPIDVTMPQPGGIPFPAPTMQTIHRMVSSVSCYPNEVVFTVDQLSGWMERIEVGPEWR